MRTLLVFVILWAVAVTTARAQGWIFSKAAYLDTPVDSSGLQALRAEEISLPPSTSLRPYTSPVQDQGTNKTCLPHALATAYSIRFRFPEADGPHFSASYIANQIEGACEKGMSMEQALKTIKANGMCPSSIFKNRPICHPPPGPVHLAAGRRYRLSLYRRIHSPGYSLTDFLLSIKVNVASGIPAIVAITYNEQFRDCKGCTVWAPSGNEPANETLHALVVIGYDDNSRFFEVVNSYGKDWGSEGFINIPYESLYHITRAVHIIE